MSDSPLPIPIKKKKKTNKKKPPKHTIMEIEKGNKETTFKQPGLFIIKTEIEDERSLQDLPTEAKEMIDERRFKQKSKKKFHDKVLYSSEFGCVLKDQEQVANSYVPVVQVDNQESTRFHVECQPLKKEFTQEMYHQAILREFQTSRNKMTSTLQYIYNYIRDLTHFMEYYESLAFVGKENDVLAHLVDQDRRSFERCIKVLENDLETCSDTETFHLSLLDKGCTLLDHAWTRFLHEFAPFLSRIKYIITKLKNNESFLIPHAAGNVKHNTKPGWWLSLRRRFWRTIDWIKSKRWIPHSTSSIWWCDIPFYLLKGLFLGIDSYNTVMRRWKGSEENDLLTIQTAGTFWFINMFTLYITRQGLQPLKTFFLSSTPKATLHRDQLCQRLNEAVESFLSTHLNAQRKDAIYKELQNEELIALLQDDSDEGVYDKLLGPESKFFEFDPEFKTFLNKQCLHSSKRQWTYTLLCLGLQLLVSHLALSASTTATSAVDGTQHNLGGWSGITTILLSAAAAGTTFIAAPAIATAASGWLGLTVSAAVIAKSATLIASIVSFAEVAQAQTEPDTWTNRTLSWLRGDEPPKLVHLGQWFATMTPLLSNGPTLCVVGLVILLLAGFCALLFKMQITPTVHTPFEIRPFEDSSSISLDSIQQLYSTVYDTYLPLNITGKRTSIPDTVTHLKQFRRKENKDRQKKLEAHPPGNYSFLFNTPSI